MTKQPRERAVLTPDQGVSSIHSLIQLIDLTPQLAGSDFGIDVRASLASMKVRLEEGSFFSEKMEKAIENWGRGISKWVTSPEGKTN